MDFSENIQKQPDSITVPRKIVYSVSLPKDTKQCRDCPYPGVGFICWTTKGSCMRTEIQKINEPRR